MEGCTYTGEPAVQLGGPSIQVGSEHYAATSVQRQVGGEKYAALRRIGYKAPRRTELTPQEATFLFAVHVDPYFEKIGFNGNSPRRIVRNRR